MQLNVKANQPERVDRLDLFRLIVRSFFLQASWNFQRMQGLGFVFALSPILQKLYKDSEERTKAFVRHLKFFNTHPYFASFILGAIARREERRAHTGSPGEEEIISFRTTVSGPYAAIGDVFFWGALRPLAAALGLAFIVPGGRAALLGPVVFFMIYNLFHLPIRIMGVIWGYFQEELVPQRLQQLNLIGLAARLRQVALIVLGAAAALTPHIEGVSWENHGLLLKLSAFLLILLFSELNRLRWSVHWQLAILAITSMILVHSLD